MTSINLVSSDVMPPYLFHEHTLAAGQATSFRCHPDDRRSFVVIAGEAQLEYVGTDRRLHTSRHGYLRGWHAAPGGVYRIRNTGRGSAVFVEAGTKNGDVLESAHPEALPHDASSYQPVSGYTVHKPWGHEVWYTENLADPPYALKQIHMTRGNQSSLQSHRFKAETNYVVDGEATVLNGLIAPEDTSAVIDPDTLPRQTHGPRTGWSSAPNVLHRVIAGTDYTSIEVSTPELDDVIRWQDDSGRGDGRIAAEHLAGRR